MVPPAFRAWPSLVLSQHAQDRLDVAFVVEVVKANPLPGRFQRCRVFASMLVTIDA